MSVMSARPVNNRAVPGRATAERTHTAKREPGASDAAPSPGLPAPQSAPSGAKRSSGAPSRPWSAKAVSAATRARVTACASLSAVAYARPAARAAWVTANAARWTTNTLRKK